jgi:FkbM family methyltransferase
MDVINRGGGGVVNLIDVGSAGGLPSPWRDHAALVRYLLNFEPLEAARRKGTVLTVPAALWRADETRPFYIQRGSSQGNSLYPPNLDYVREHFAELSERGPRELARTWFERSAVARVETIETTTLDAVLESLAPEVRYDFLKIDTQGADLDVLRGAERFLAHDCVGIQLEAFVVPLYAGIACLPEIDAYLDERGFERVWTAPPHGTFDSQHDVLYLRRDAAPSAALDAIRTIYRLDRTA